MAFVCPPKEETETITQTCCQLKNALQQLTTQLTVGVKPICVPCCVPICPNPCPPPCEGKDGKESHQQEFDPPQIMVCYREPCKKSKAKPQAAKEEEDVIRLHQSKSRELRASILYTGCQCEKRDGLQDDCPRTGCHGSPECLTSPPTCGPSEFSSGKHLGKKNKYSYLYKKSNGSKNGNGEGHESDSTAKARYKCYPATVDQPFVLPIDPKMLCCPCPPCS